MTTLSSSAKATAWLRRAVIAVWTLAIAAGTFLPVYTDEVGWRFQERAGFDGVDKMFNDLCGPNTLARPPLFMMPVRWFSAQTNALFADPFWVRVSGVLYALVFGWLLWRVIVRAAPDQAARNRLALLGFGLLSLGTLPLLMVLSRPEQPLILAAAGAVLLALSGTKEAGTTGDTPTGAAWARSLGVLALALVALSYHLKGLFLLPVFLAALILASRGRTTLWPRLVAGILLLAATGLALAYWSDRFQCPGDPHLAAELSHNNIGAVLTGKHGLEHLPFIIGKIAGQIGLIPYVALAGPRVVPLSSWLPAHQIGHAGAWHWFLALVTAWGAAILAGGAAMALAAWQGWTRRRIDPRLILALALLITALGWSATQLIRNFYEAGFVLPLLVLALVLALSAALSSARFLRLTRFVALPIALFALVSPPLIAGIYGSSLADAARQTAYLPDQPASVPVFGYGTIRPDILGAARLCEITDPAKTHALMIDDTTYFALMRGTLPQHRLGVLGLWRGRITDPVAYLKSRGSSGAVVGCHWLPPALRARARQQGQFCCLGPPGW